MGSVEVVVNQQGVIQMLGSPEVQAVLKGKADQVCETAKSMVSPDNMTNEAFYSHGGTSNKGFARAWVYTGNPHAYNACLSDNVLLKALG